MLVLREVENRLDVAERSTQGMAPSDRHLAWQPTISRLENKADARDLLHVARASVDLHCWPFGQGPKRLVLDIDETFDAVHGSQRLRVFNARFQKRGRSSAESQSRRFSSARNRRPLST